MGAEAPAAESEEARRERRLAVAPEALREALSKLDADAAEPALAFFAKEHAGRSGSVAVVLATEAEGGAQIVLKLDFDAMVWKRVRKKAKQQ